MNGYGSWFCEGKAWMNRDDRDLERPHELNSNHCWRECLGNQSIIGTSVDLRCSNCRLQPSKNGRLFFCNARSERISMHLINSSKRLQYTWRSSGRQYEPITPNCSKGKNNSQHVTAFTTFMRWGNPCLVMLHPEVPSLRLSKPGDVQWPSRMCVLLSHSIYSVYEWLLQSFFVFCFLQVHLEIYHYGRAFLVAC